MQAHSLLLDRWAEHPRHHKQAFIRDGIIHADLWAQASPRVGFILREAYGEPGFVAGWDLCSLIRDEWKGPKHNIWWNAAYWAYAAQNGTQSLLPPIPSCDKKWSEAGRALLSSAVVNIKKSGGSSSSNLEEIKEYARQDMEFLCQQISMINAEIWICGGTWAVLQEAAILKEPKVVSHRVWEANSSLFIDFWHAAKHFPHDLNFYSISALLHNCRIFCAQKPNKPELVSQ